MTERKNPFLEEDPNAHDRRSKRPRLEDARDVDATPEASDAPAGSSSTDSLAGLLDFTALCSDSDISDRFGEIARSLLYDHILAISSGSASTSAAASTVEYEFLEVEFYLRKADVHEDPFTHGTKEQSNSGRWYFHRAPRKSEDPSKSATSSGYRGGTRKGLDLTIGGPCASPHFASASSSANQSESSAHGPRGGVLLRSMRRLSDQVIISGPSLLFDEVLRAAGAKSIAELVAQKLRDDTSAFGSASASSSASLSNKPCSMRLRRRAAPLTRKPVLYTSPRIGLDLSHPGTLPTAHAPRVVFLARPYRFFLHPALLTANGRAQTFLGVHALLSEAGILGGAGVRAETARLTGLARAVVDKYAAAYDEGRARGRVEAFVGPKGKGASSSPGTYLRMMGAVEALTS